jgi:ferredoxin
MNENQEKIIAVSAGELRNGKSSASENFTRRRKSEKDFLRFMKWSSILHSRGYTRVHEINNIIWKGICLEACEASKNGQMFKSSMMMRENFINNFIENFPAWKNIRKNIFDRDGNKCTNCGSEKLLEAHHKKQVRFGGISSYENLITLCKSCHKDQSR